MKPTFCHLFLILCPALVCGAAAFAEAPSPPVCGDGYCDSYAGENCTTCPVDCAIPVGTKKFVEAGTQYQVETADGVTELVTAEQDYWDDVYVCGDQDNGLVSLMNPRLYGSGFNAIEIDSVTRGGSAWVAPNPTCQNPGLTPYQDMCSNDGRRMVETWVGYSFLNPVPATTGGGVTCGQSVYLYVTGQMDCISICSRIANRFVAARCRPFGGATYGYCACW